MQSLIDTVRATGAAQPIMVAGLGYGNDLSGWLTHPLRDPLSQLIAGVHMYDNGYCHTVACWNGATVSVGKHVPILAGELGEFDRRSDFITSYLQWAETRPMLSISFLAWSWDAALGEGGPSLITSDNGTPTRFGLGFRTYLEKLFDRGEIKEG
jgi:hypothetical protein